MERRSPQGNPTVESMLTFRGFRTSDLLLTADRSAPADPPAPDRLVAGAFAYERDAATAAQLIGDAGIVGRYVISPRFGERGNVDLVVLEVQLARAIDRARVEMLITGVHGVVIDIDTDSPTVCGPPRV